LVFIYFLSNLGLGKQSQRGDYGNESPE